MSEEDALIPVEQRQVAFYGDDLIAIRGNDGHVYVAIGQMCDALGIDRASQTRRIRSDELLATGYQGSVNLTYPDGGTQASGVLRVDLIPLWLTGLRTKAVREEVRPKLDRFKREAAKVLWEAFQEGRLTADLTFDELLQTDSEAVQAYKMLQALVKLARNQVLLESQLETHTGQIADHEKRLEQVEETLSDSGRHVTPDQASQISQAVKAVAHAMGGHGKHYQAVYGEMYRKFSLTSYKLLPARRFQEAMKWLTDWYVDLTGSKDIPF